MNQRIAAKAIIALDGKVLVLREAATYDDGTNHGRYHLPGGRVEIGETFDDALRREVSEETGLYIEIGAPLHVGEWHPTIKGEPTQIIGVFVVCQPTTQTVTLSTEHDDYQWIDPASYDIDVMQPEDEVLRMYAAMSV